MPVVGVYKGRELIRVMGTDTYLARLPRDPGVEDGTTHDVHVKVRLGRFDSQEQAFDALTRKVDSDLERSDEWRDR